MQKVHAGIRHRKLGCNSLDRNMKKVKKVRMNQDFKKKTKQKRGWKRDRNSFLTSPGVGEYV